MSQFLKNVFKLGSATIIAQLLGILLVPVITRIYTPADFGISQIFISIVTIIGAVSCFSYYRAIMLPEKEIDAANILILCSILIFIVSIVTGVIFWVFSNWLEIVLNAPGLSGYLIILPLAIFFNGFYLTLTYWVSRRKRYGIQAVSKVSSSIINKMVQIGWGLISGSPIGLISGSIANDFSATIVMSKGFKSDLIFFRDITLSKLKALAIRYKKFPVFTTPGNLANIASVNVTSFILAFFFSPIIVGYYALAYTAVKLPVKLIGDSIGNVFYQKTSEEMIKTGNIHIVVQIVHKRLVSIGIFPFLSLMIIGESLFIIIFGKNWAAAGFYAQIIAPWLFFIFISAPLNNIFYVMEKQVEGLVFNVVLLVSRIGSLFIGGITGDPIIALLLFSSTGVIFWGSMNIYLLYIAKVNIGDSIWDIIKYLLIGLLTVTPLIIGKYYFSGSVLLILAMIMALFYYSVIIREDDILREEIILTLKRIMKVK